MEKKTTVTERQIVHGFMYKLTEVESTMEVSEPVWGWGCGC